MAGPYTISVPIKGQPTSASAFGVPVRDAINDLHTRVAALETGVDPIVRMVQRNAPQSLANGTATALTFDTASEDFVTAGFHSGVTNPSRVTPNVPGYYMIRSTCSMATGSAAYSQISAAVGKNGTRTEPQSVARPDPTTAANSTFTTAFQAANGSTDYFEIFGSQTSGASQNTSSTAGFRSTFELFYLRPL